MRIMFSTIVVLGLFLIGLSVFEIRIVSEYQSKAEYVQKYLADFDKSRVDEAKRKHSGYFIESLEYKFLEDTDGIKKIREAGCLLVFVEALFVLSELLAFSSAISKIGNLLLSNQISFRVFRGARG